METELAEQPEENAKIPKINIISKEGYYIHKISIGSFEIQKRDTLKCMIIYNDY